MDEAVQEATEAMRKKVEAMGHDADLAEALGDQVPVPGALITVRSSGGEREGGLLYRRSEKKDKKKKGRRHDGSRSFSGSKKPRRA